MSTYGLLPFIAVFSLSVALPGPGVAAVVARGLTRGTAGTYAFIAEMTLGDLAWFACAATGLAALAQNVQIAVSITVIVPVILGAYAWAAARARRFFASERAVRRLNRACGAVMAGAAVMVAAR